MEVENKNFEKFIQGISRIDNFSGFNITVPYKTNALKHLNRISPEASLINAVNTIKITKNRMHGFNTDYFGFKRSIAINFPKFNLRGKNILLLGAGGASKAVALVLLKNKIGRLCILNRTIKNGMRLKNELKKVIPRPKIEAFGLDHDYMKNGAPDIIVNTTSVGLKNTDKALLDLKYLKGKKTLVYDLIYNPPKTRLLISAVKYKLLILNGLDMLILQAIKSFSIWTGISVEDELMKCVKPLREKLKNEFY